MVSSRKQDTLDRLVVFLAKRDGIDKLVKTFQYVSKLANWGLQGTNDPFCESMGEKAKRWEVSCGLSRKAFRTGRFLTGLNALRHIPPPSPSVSSSPLILRVLPVLANAGEMVYFFFDHLLWLSRIEVLSPSIARKMSFISAFGESFGYIFFVAGDLISIRHGLQQERLLLELLQELKKEKVLLRSPASSCSCSSDDGDGEDEDEESVAKIDSRIKEAQGKLRSVRMQRIMQVMAISANLADLIIAIADIEPNPFCNHAVTLGISGLVSAWAGWYRNWPSS